MRDRGMLNKQEQECYEMFRIYDTGAHDLAALKTNVKKHEYILYGGRPEFYPEDRKAILTLLQFKRERIDIEQRHAETKERMQNKMRTGR